MQPEELDAFRRGDPALFRTLVERHSPRLLALARHYGRDTDEAHDAVQEVWLRAFGRRGQLLTAGALVGWLMTTCRNVCYGEARRAAVRSREEGADVPGAIPGSPPPPDARTVRSELRADVSAAIAELPERQRDTVVLRLMEGRSTRETAELLECAEGTVKAALHQALKNLEPMLRSWNDVVVSRD